MLLQHRRKPRARSTSACWNKIQHQTWLGRFHCRKAGFNFRSARWFDDYSSRGFPFHHCPKASLSALSFLSFLWGADRPIARATPNNSESVECDTVGCQLAPYKGRRCQATWCNSPLDNDRTHCKQHRQRRQSRGRRWRLRVVLRIRGREGNRNWGMCPMSFIHGFIWYIPSTPMSITILSIQLLSVMSGIYNQGHEGTYRRVGWEYIPYLTPLS